MALVAALVAYYGRVVRMVGEPLAGVTLKVLMEHTPIARRWSFADLDGVARLVLAGLMQLCFIVALIAALPLTAHELLPADFDVRLILLGVPLGVAEAALATYVAYVGSRVAEWVRPGTTPSTVEGWLSVARGGWIRYYLRTASAAPTWLLVVATVLYVAGEEIVFRAIVLTSLSGLHAVAAVGISVVLFALAQVFYTPGWQTAMFPVLGAIVVGTVHAVLFLQVPDVTPLIVAHATMFLVTVR